ncbi:CusA/CzcA family heavy metal efflux RND transporter [Capnocytophaga periodontitidis]|uniref:CusA/CzcA family heavy metal efflux RND transporter n=1 Tax=Capnocytophaga periodontitidis TaxID=2795027 RepID=UPI0018E10BB5|nr:CusA/CzcA family heavy metal efflux RND transporter [Capnocytophaga periodontitidis]MBI1668669.1 CusA/CzcA family heavy metal efflux RND transporter [Capnocytophaga periodontitidis]
MLDKIIKFSIKNKFLVGLMTLALIIWGVWSAMRLPIDAVPDITNNQVQIITSTPTLASQEVEQLVTFPIEQAIANIPGLEETRSISRFGLSVITAVFSEDMDIYFARQLVNEKLKEAQEQIPKGIGTPELSPVSTGLGEIYQYIIRPTEQSKNKYSAKDLRTMQDWIVARQLYGTKGIAEINSFGGELKQYEVVIDPDRLRAMGVSVSDIFTALEQNNQNTGGAYIDKRPNAYFIRGIGMARSLEDIGNIAVGKHTPPLFIKHVAEVRLGSAIRYGALTYNGEVDAVGGVVMMLKGENSHEVVSRIKEKLPTIQQSLPEDVVIEPFLDRTDLVQRAIHTVEKNLLEGALIVIFILVLFLGNLRAGLIVATAIPLSLLFALGMMNLFGVSANLMSLGAIDFGIIVDGSVIVVEAVMHHLAIRKNHQRLTQTQMDEEVFHSASKIRSSAAFGEIIILMVYIPILSLVGVEGKMFRPMAQTVVFAILGALILSLTYIPAMSALLLPKTVSDKRSFAERMISWLYRHYQPLFVRSIRLRGWIIGSTMVLFVLAVGIFSRMGGEFIPQLQEGDFAFHCILPPGTSLKQSLETSMQASRLIREFDEVKMVIGKTGSAEVPTDPMPLEASDIVIVLKSQDQWKSGRSYEELGDAIIERLKDIPGVFFEKNQPIQMRFNELMTGIRQDVAVKIFGENMDTLAHYAQRVSQLIQKTEGATAPQVEKVSGLPQINVTYDRVRLANYGLSVQEVNEVLSTAFAGKKAGVVFENERRFDLVVRLDSLHRTGIDDVQHMMVATENGQVPMSQLATIKYELGPAQVSREAGKRRIVIGFNVQGRDVQSVVSDIEQKLKGVKLPTGYYFTYGGQFENLQQATDRLLIAVPVALLLIFFLLYLAFHSIKQSLLIFSAIPMSAIGGVFALLLRGMPFSISAGIGFIALFGVAVLNGIVLIGTFNQLKKEGMTNLLHRVITGTEMRLRPVLMTAMVASLGFLPMALSQGAGAEVQRPLATVVIGGLVSATFLTLFVLPLLYIAFNSTFSWRRPSAKVLTIALLLISPIALHAQQSYSLQEIEQIALKNNGVIKAAQLKLQGASAKERTSFELAKTDFTGQYGQYSSAEKDLSVGVSQSIPLPTVFAARKKLYQAETQLQQGQLALQQNELKRQVRNAYQQLQYLTFKEEQLLQLDSLYNNFIRIAEVRYKAGDTKKIDINTAQVKKGEISLLLQQNKTIQQATYRNLRTLMQTEEAFTITKSPVYEPLLLSEPSDVQLSQHPLVQLSYQEANIAEYNKCLERAQALPDLTLGYTNQSLIGMQTIGGVETYTDRSKRFHFATIGLSVPIFTATRAKVKAYKYQKEAAIEAAQQTEKQLKTQWINLQEEYQLNLQKYQFYKQEALPEAERIIRANQLGYSAGEISYVEYLYTLQTAVDTRLAYLESIEALNQKVIEIQSLLNQ